MEKVKILGLCKGRHEIPGVDNYVYPTEVDPLDLDGLQNAAVQAVAGVESVHLYVTGLTVALVAVINACKAEGVALTLYHFNRDTGDYYPQAVL